MLHRNNWRPQMKNPRAFFIYIYKAIYAWYHSQLLFNSSYTVQSSRWCGVNLLQWFKLGSCLPPLVLLRFSWLFCPLPEAFPSQSLVLPEWVYSTAARCVEARPSAKSPLSRVPDACASAPRGWSSTRCMTAGLLTYSPLSLILRFCPLCSREHRMSACIIWGC